MERAGFGRAGKKRRIGMHSLQIMLIDAGIVLLAYFIVFAFRYAGVSRVTLPENWNLLLFAGLAVIVHLGINWVSRIYSIMDRYMSLIQAVRVAQSGIIATAILFVIAVTWRLYTPYTDYLMPRAVVVGGGVLSIISMIGVRFTFRVIREVLKSGEPATENLLLVGAGQAADMLVREIQRTPSMNSRIVGLVDDNPALANMTLHGFPILGTVEDTPAIVTERGVTQIVVALPSASASEVARIYRLCKPAGVPVKILPSLADLVNGTVSLGDARDLDIKDLLGRPKIETDVGAISKYVKGETVLVTGAGGSIGSELCRQLARFDPSRLVLLDHDESSLYDLHERLQKEGFNRYSLYPTSILDENKLERIFAKHAPRMVFHAAAYKHVPLMEMSPDEAVLNNVLGTQLVATTAARYGVERVVNISTDKAVEPCNVMGATKRAGELLIRGLAKRYPRTHFASVRFGNVLGSQGSVIPIFKSQIESGGPLVITHPDMTRYFMLIEEAVQLVIQAAMMIDEDGVDRDRGLHTFVLEMGDPVAIIELAQKMIDFYWKDHSRSMGVEFSGLRPGEKMDERLTYEYEEALPTSHPLVKRVCAKQGTDSEINTEQFDSEIAELIELARDRVDKTTIVAALMTCVPGYAPLNRLPVEQRAAIV